ncbi:hypothetical protein ACFYOF_20800 [Streptomyces sp. NPDC007148]|uniref:hypothetical protein n=1 Tax=Streptomyces sp. NPDC007148 TaxID=3364775 RepID=UPI0036BC9123
MTDLIRVRPIRARLVDFARWAVAQTPKVRTVSTNTFAVPLHLFTHMPETLLIDSIVDGHRYISPDEDQESAQPEPATIPGPDSTPLPPPDFAPLEDAPTDYGGSDPDDELAEESGGRYACGDCPRDFSTKRGRDLHRRQAHRED